MYKFVSFLVAVILLVAACSLVMASEPKQGEIATEVSATSLDGQYDVFSTWPLGVPLDWTVARNENRFNEKIPGGRTVFLRNRSTGSSVELKVLDILGQEPTVLVNTEDQQEVVIHKGYGHLASPVFSPDNKMVAAYDFRFDENDGNLFIWSIPDGKLLKTIELNEQGVGMIRFSPNSKMIATSNGVYDVKSGKRLGFWSDGYCYIVKYTQKKFNMRMNISAIAWSPNGDYILIGGFQQDCYKAEIRIKLGLKKFILKSGKLQDVKIPGNIDPRLKNGYVDVQLVNNDLTKYPYCSPYLEVKVISCFSNH